MTDCTGRAREGERGERDRGTVAVRKGEGKGGREELQSYLTGGLL